MARREFLRAGGALAFTAIAPAWAAGSAPGAAPHAAARSSRVVIVGAGLAGLTAAYELGKAGVHATVVEGSPRLGGRCWTERGAFADGQIAERGGELIDTTHEAIRALCAHFELPLDDLIATEPAGSEALAWFDGAPYTVADIDRDFVRILPALDRDAKTLGDDLPTYAKHTAAQRELDRMPAARWIETRVPGGASSRFGQLLVNAYGEELGGDPDEISAVTVVSLLAGSPRDRFSPYEESDQRFHIRGGNDLLVARLAASVPGPIETGTRLVALTQRRDGPCRLVVLRDGAERELVADRVILALPFSLLRVVDLRQSGFPARKLRSIDELGMGRNTKLQLQFDDRFWLRARCNGEYRLRGSFQTTWEVTRAQPGSAGILNFFSGGSAAVAAGTGDIDTRARAALAEIAGAAPGSAAAWNGRVIRNAWDRNPWSLGSYALIRPGQYTSFYGIEAAPAGAVHFAGEHTSVEVAGLPQRCSRVGPTRGGRSAGVARGTQGPRRLRRRPSVFRPRPGDVVVRPWGPVQAAGLG